MLCGVGVKIHEANSWDLKKALFSCIPCLGMAGGSRVELDSDWRGGPSAG